MNKYHKAMNEALKDGPEIKKPNIEPEKKQTNSDLGSYSDLGSSVTNIIKNRNKRLQDALKQ